ncbi:MAG: methionyl-tRNA formyltransferase [Actinomycetota bacterium]
MVNAQSVPPRRLVYFGTPEMAVAPLEALVQAGFEVVAVVTRVDKRRGRGSDLLPSPVKRAAIALGLPVFHQVDDVLALGADLGVVVAFGQLIKPHALAALPMVNLHFSLLPRWRGAAPVERALLAGDDVTGVCLMQLDEGLDTGPIHECETVAIGPLDTAVDLRHRLVDVGARLLVTSLQHGLGAPRPQEGEPTYAAKLGPLDYQLDWARSAIERHRVVRLGGAYTSFRGKRLKVLDAALVDPNAVGDVLDGALVGGLQLVTVQPESKGPMPFAAFANGARPRPGERLGE